MQSQLTNILVTMHWNECDRSECGSPFDLDFFVVVETSVGYVIIAQESLLHFMRNIRCQMNMNQIGAATYWTRMEK